MENGPTTARAQWAAGEESKPVKDHVTAPPQKMAVNLVTGLTKKQRAVTSKNVQVGRFFLYFDKRHYLVINIELANQRVNHGYNLW